VLKDSRALVMFDGEEMIAFLRYKLDGAFGVYIYDLLVDNERRGHNYGKALISRLQAKYPNDYIYVMSDNDGYYRHLGFEIEGTIFKIQNGR
ncbi:MAG: GNAT family N-acetyltransferase, partial [Bacilli bacterium]